MNKKILSIILCVALSSLVVGCGNSAKTSETNTNVAEETNKDQIKLNEPFEVKTESGDYKFTITGVSKTDWWNRAYNNNDKQVILLNLECENVSFKNKEHNGVIIQGAFNLKDNNNYKLDSFSMGYDDVNVGYTEILPGEKSKVSLPFVAEANAESITVSFVRGGTIENVTIE